MAGDNPFAEVRALLALDDQAAAGLDANRLKALIADRRKRWTLQAADARQRAEALERLKALQKLEASLGRLGGAEEVARRLAAAGEAVKPSAHDEQELEALSRVALAGRAALGTRQREALRAEAVRCGIAPGAVEAFLSRLPAQPAVPVAGPPTVSIPLPERAPAIAPTRWQALHRGFRALGKRTIYDLLGVAPDCAAPALASAARQWLAAHEADGPSRASVEDCLACFESPEARREYDNAAFNESVRDYAAGVDLALAGDVTTHDQIDFLIALGLRHYGLTGAEARQCVASRMSAHGTTLLIRPQDVRWRGELARLGAQAADREQLTERRQRLLDRYEHALRQRRLYEAESLLRALEATGTDTLPATAHELHARLERVRDGLQEIDRLSHEPGSRLLALQRCAALLGKCTDCAEALLVLRTLAPDTPPAPVNLRVALCESHRHLTWELPEAAPADCVFEVRRARSAASDESARPVFELIATVPERSCVDLEDAAPGAALHYTVRTVLRGALRVLGKVVREYDVASAPASPVSVSVGAVVREPEPPRVEHRPAARARRVVWRFGSPGAETPRPLRTSAAVEWEQRIYACLGETVVALNADGSELWTCAIGARTPGSPVLDGDGGLRIHAGDGKLHCLDTDGRPRWGAVAVGEPLGWATPLVERDGTTWICARDGGLLRVNADGRIAPRPFLRSMQCFDCTGVIAGGVCYVGAEDGCVHAIDLRGPKGREVWDSLAGEGRTGWFSNSALLVDSQSRIIAASRDNRLYAFESSGRVAWTYELPGVLMGAPVADGDGRFFLALMREGGGPGAVGSLVCFDSAAQRTPWTYSCAAAIESTPVIGDDGMVYFGDNAGVVHAVDAAGAPAWTDALDSPVRSAGTLVAPHRLVFGLDDGTLVALECTSTGLGSGWPKLLRGHANMPVV